jgi:DNA helicase II / ATP-dependent DNA helicase PcrA
LTCLCLHQDEYQDTSRAQIDLVRLWTSSSLFVVGDGDQSIYSWRGADAYSLSTFEEEFKSFLGEVGTVLLKENYRYARRSGGGKCFCANLSHIRLFALFCRPQRSTSQIVDAAQKVIDSANVSSPELRPRAIPKRGRGVSPRVIACEDDAREASFVISTIKNMLETGDTQDKTVAILYRTNAQSRSLEEHCVKQNIPYVILGKATSFYKRREVKDCLCFLRWLYNGRDKGSMLRAFQTPARGLGDKGIEQFQRYCTLVDDVHTDRGSPTPNELDILLSFCSPEEDGMPIRMDTIASRPLKLFIEFAHQMRTLVDLAYSAPLEQVLATVIDDFGLMAHFDKISESKTEFQERQSNVQELQHATKRYTEDGSSLQWEPQTDDAEPSMLASIKSPLGAFLDDVALITDISNDEDSGQDTSPEKRFVVSLMTIHCAKGMEFDCVFVVGNEDGNLPSSQAIQAGEGSVALEEERRLCYVAITRAKSELILTWRRNAIIFSQNGMQTVKRDRSRFLNALVKEKGGLNKSPVPVTTQAQGRGHSQRQQRSHHSLTENARVRNGHSNSGAREFSNDAQPRRSSGGVPSARTVASRVPVNNRPDRSSRLSATTTSIDSTWFFPVGTAVRHKKHGRGLVLEPPASNQLLVRVEFENGHKTDLPAHGGELIPDFL